MELGKLRRLPANPSEACSQCSYSSRHFTRTSPGSACWKTKGFFLGDCLGAGFLPSEVLQNNGTAGLMQAC